MTDIFEGKKKYVHKEDWLVLQSYRWTDHLDAGATVPMIALLVTRTHPPIESSHPTPRCGKALRTGTLLVLLLLYFRVE